MPDNHPRQEVAVLLQRTSDLLAHAAAAVGNAAGRAATGDAGRVDEGAGYHFLVAQALNTLVSVQTNAPLAQAFAAAAEADRA